MMNRLKIGVRALLYRSPFHQIPTKLYINRHLKARSPILIYTPPKTGSSTVHSYLKSAGLDRPLYKVHYLSPKNLEISAAKYRKENRADAPIVRRSKRLGRAIATDSNIEWTIITLTREPFSRAVSALFQTIDRRHPELIDQNGEVIVDEAVELLKTELTLFDAESTRICRWFDEELRYVFGIDVYEHPFNHEAGFTIIRKDNVQILIVRLEDLNRCFRAAVRDLLSVELPPHISSKNLSKEKKLSDAYKLCRQRLRLPKNVCQEICDSQYVRHFYREPEREQMIRKYSQA